MNNQEYYLSPPPPPPVQPPAGKSNSTVLALIAGFLAGVLVCGFGVFVYNNLFSGGGQVAAPETGTVQDQPDAPPADSEPVSESDSVCGLAAGDQTIPTTPILSTPTSVAESVKVPFMKDNGPGITEPIPHCFAHNPTGAVLAAAHFYNWIGVPSNDKLVEAMGVLLAPGPDRERSMADATNRQHAETMPEIVGFNINMRSDDDALVTIIADYQHKLIAFDYAVRWIEGDWKVVPPPTNAPAVRQMNPSESYVLWAAGN